MNKLFTISAEFFKISPFRLFFICIFSIFFFSAYGQGTISGSVWHDLNGNGQQDGESYINGFDVELRVDGTGALVSSTTTAAGGSYSFNSIPVGTYYIRFVINAPNIITPSGFGTPTTNCDVTNANGAQTTSDFVITGAENISDIDAGYYLYSNIGDKVWHDQNANGIQDGTEPGIDGIQVTISGNSGTGAVVNQNVITSGGGNFQFTNIPPGPSYTINFDNGATYQITYQGEGGNTALDSDADPGSGDVTGINIESDDDITDIDCGLYIFGIIGNFVWEDENGNGIQDGAEPGVGGVDITLIGTTGNGDAVNENTTSDGAGNYAFNSVIPGNYTLTFDEPVPLKRTYANQGGNDNIDSDADVTTGNTVSFNIVSDQDDNKWDAGYYIYSQINGYTWHDINGDAFFTAEPAIGGVTVTLTGTNGIGGAVNLNDVTDGSGYYEFDQVPPGTGYMIHFGNAAGYDGFTNPVTGGDSYPDPTNGNTVTFDVTSNQLFEDIDAGYIKYIGVGDFVWEDMNGNGLQDGGEPGVGGVTVRLVRSSDNAIMATTVTDGAGQYEFDATDEVGPGQFFVAFEPPAGYGFTLQGSGGTNDSDPNEGTGWTDNFDMDSGDQRDDIDAGLFRPVLIGDQCWRDQNTNGLQDGGEFVMPDVEVWLYRASDNVEIDYEVTDANGLYYFGTDEAIKPGEYYVKFGIPATFLITIKDAGADNIDSDADQGTGETDNFTILSNGTNTDIDCGFFVEPPDDCDGESAPQCVDAEVICELQQLNEFCLSMDPAWQQVPIPGCGSGYAFHNPSWFAFVAGDENVSLIIHAAPCVSGGGNVGIQWGIYDDCDLQGPVILQCPCMPSGDIPVNLYGLNVGQTYYFFIDGCSGTMCTYWIEILSGGGVPNVLGPNNVTCDSNFPNCESICAGADVTFTLEDVNNASHYSWDINGSIIETDDPFLTTQFATPGTYEICVYGFNDCSEGDPYCFEVDIVMLPPEDLGSFEVCENDLEAGFEPPDWVGGPLTTEGVHTTDTQTPEGCIYQQVVEIIKLPIEVQNLDTIGCTNETMMIEGQTFFYDVNDYEIIIPNGGTNGCNKRLLVDIHFLHMQGYLDAACSGDPDLPVRITFSPDWTQSTPVDDIVVHWLRNGWEIPDDDLNNIYDINVDQDGTYSIYLKLASDGVDCIFGDFNEVNVDLNSFLPTPPIAVEWQQSVCSNAGTYIDYVITGTNPDYTYDWDYPSDVFSAAISPDGTKLTINWLGSAGGDVCVHAVDAICGHSDTICYPVQVFPAPNAAFILNDTICQTESDLIAYTGIATSAANFTWNFSGGTETSGTGGVGIGPHSISWNSPGTKIVSLHVEENGCSSDFLEKTVEVVSPPSIPVISCTSTATSVTFEWDPVSGSTGTVVVPISGDPGVQNGNSYSITGLDPKEAVTISLLVQTNGICPGFTTDQITCQAQDCPIVSVNSTPIDTTICYDGTNAAFLLNKEINPAGNGIVTWIGTGITDPATGLFDPKVAGVGNHIVTLKYEFSECTYTDKTNIHIFEQPTANFGISTDTICIKDAALITYNGNAPTGTPNWNFDGGTVISGSGLAQHTIKWNTIGLKNINLSVENNGCISKQISAPILVQDTLDDIFINCSPSVNDVNFSWNLDPLADSYKVFINGVEVSNSLITSWLVNGLNPGDKVDITVIATYDGVCGSKTSSSSCEARECPTYTINITPNVNEVCLDANTLPIQFVANITSTEGDTGGTKKWSGPGINQTTGLFDPKVAGPGTHTIKFDYHGICDASANFKITVIERPESQFTVENDVICIKDSIVIDYSNSNPTGTVYNWQLDGGQRKNISASKFSVKWTAPGTYNLSLITDNKGCVSNETKVSVTVEPELKLPVISCVNATTNSVEIQWNDIDCATNYKVTANGIEVANNANLSYKVQNLNSNSSVNFTVEAISDCACGNVKVSKSCKTEPCPNVALSIQNLPEHLCAAFANTVKLDAIITGPQNGVLTWSGTGIGNDGTINLKDVGIGKFIYKLDYVLENCAYSSKDSILITPEPVFNLTKQDPLCHNEQNGEIYAPLQAGVTYSLAGNISPDGKFTGLPAGNHTVLAKDTYGCETIESIDLVNPPQLDPGIAGDVIIKENQKNKFELINVSNVEISNIIWSLINEGVLCQGADCTSIDFGIESDDTLCVEIIDKNDCSASTCLAVTFLENIDIDIPNIFSPDGDGKNDIFYVKADRSVEAIKEMRIYDRWGEMVFFTENVPVNEESYGWNGQFKGKRLNPGVYVYYIVFKLKERPEMKMAGDVTIVK